MQKFGNKKVKPNILNLNQNRLLNQTLKNLFGYGLIKNQKIAAIPKDCKKPGVAKFLVPDLSSW